MRPLPRFLPSGTTIVPHYLCFLELRSTDAFQEQGMVHCVIHAGPPSRHGKYNRRGKYHRCRWFRETKCTPQVGINAVLIVGPTLGRHPKLPLGPYTVRANEHVAGSRVAPGDPPSISGSETVSIHSFVFLAPHQLCILFIKIFLFAQRGPWQGNKP